MNQNQNNVENIETSKIIWRDGFVTAESFVRAWQQSNSVKDLQIKMAIAAKEQGKLQWELDYAQRQLAKVFMRFAALKSGNVECDVLTVKDVCAINETNYEYRYHNANSQYRHLNNKVPSLAVQIEDAERDVQRRAKNLIEAQERQDSPELCDWSCGDWGAVPGADSCQNRAARYRKKGVELKVLPHQVQAEEQESPKSFWEELAELAKEAACN